MVSIKVTNQETKEVIKRNVPTSWEDLTLEMFCRLLDVYQINDKPDSFEIIAAIIDVPVDWIRDAKLKDVDSSIFYYVGFLSEGEKWDDMWKIKGKKFEVDGNEYELIDDISEHLTLGQKEEIMQVLLNEQSTMLQKSIVVLNTFYLGLSANNLGIQAATRIFPVVAFFLTKLRNSMITGQIRSGDYQGLMNTLQG